MCDIEAKLKQLGITKDLLLLFSNYLTGRKLHVMVNGCTSASFTVEVSVPQGSVLGPVLNDLLQSITTAAAYTDDCTLSQNYVREEV